MDKIAEDSACRAKVQPLRDELASILERIADKTATPEDVARGLVIHVTLTGTL